jgi:hypothetical protein
VFLGTATLEVELDVVQRVANLLERRFGFRGLLECLANHLNQVVQVLIWLILCYQRLDFIIVQPDCLVLKTNTCISNNYH